MVHQKKKRGYRPPLTFPGKYRVWAKKAWCKMQDGAIVVEYADGAFTVFSLSRFEQDYENEWINPGWSHKSLK
jgi:hypothetical protein